MFSFLKSSFKKLFNLQKTDANSVEKDKQVELESNDENFRFEDIIKIKDTDLNNRFKGNKNYQRDELTKYSNFSSFHSNETASTSSDKRQRQSSKLAAKKIAKIADRLSLGSDEEISDEGDDVIDKSSEQKIKTSDETKLIEKPNKRNLYRRTVRFCQECKTHNIFVGSVTKRKLCDTCKSILLYICSNCKEKLYASHKGWKAHESICNQKNTILKLANVQNESVLHQYSDYSLNEKSMSFNVIKSDHTTGHGKKQLRDLRGARNENDTEASLRKVHNKKAVTVDKQIKTKTLTKWIRRYCEECQKTMKLSGISKIRNNTKCRTCSTLLQFLCVKCHSKYNSNSDINCHFQSKCSPINYKCSKCNFHSINAKALSLHLKIQHPVTLQCDMCTYQSQFKSNLQRHIFAIHLQKRLCCQKCSFITANLRILRRHEQRSHSTE